MMFLLNHLRLIENHLQKKSRLLEEKSGGFLMSNIINRIKSIKHVEFSKGATKEQIRDAEKTLQLKFPKDYSDYLNVFGCISFFGTEWTGLNERII